MDIVKKKLEYLLIVSLGKALDGIPLRVVRQDGSHKWQLDSNTEKEI